MKSGIEKEEILGILTNMAHSLEETEISLHESLRGTREKMCVAHASQLTETGILLDRMEGKLSQPINPALQAMPEQSSLKLELSF